MDTEELQQLAFLGLASAADRYDTAADHDFLAFAVPWMTGTIRHHFRHHTWAIRPTRRLQDLHQRLTGLEACWGRTMGSPEVASALGISSNEAHEVRAVRTLQKLTSLDAVPRHNLPWSERLPAPEAPEMRLLEARLELRPLLMLLSSREGHVLRRLYVDEWSQSRVGGELGLSQMQISRIHQRALQTMRAVALAPHP